MGTFIEDRRAAVKHYLGDLCWMRCNTEGFPLYKDGKVIVLCQKHHRNMQQDPEQPPEGDNRSGEWPWRRWNGGK